MQLSVAGVTNTFSFDNHGPKHTDAFDSSPNTLETQCFSLRMVDWYYIKSTPLHKNTCGRSSEKEALFGRAHNIGLPCVATMFFAVRVFYSNEQDEDFGMTGEKDHSHNSPHHAHAHPTSWDASRSCLAATMALSSCAVSKEGGTSWQMPAIRIELKLGLKESQLK